mgnify:CR=1 FL=1|tara:strand:- start:616 stop:816 length:201 start_codon:yes stop_codon:yes gene_type:complete
MSLENHMVVGPDDFDEVVECTHLGEMTVDYFNWSRYSVKYSLTNKVRIRCVDCGAVFEGGLSEVIE